MSPLLARVSNDSKCRSSDDTTASLIVTVAGTTMRAERCSVLYSCASDDGDADTLSVDSDRCSELVRLSLRHADKYDCATAMASAARVQWAIT